MGYYTNYSIEVKGKPLNGKELAEILNLEAEAKKLKGKLKEAALKGLEIQRKQVCDDPETIICRVVGYDPFKDNCKWYEHDTHMKTVSLAHPETVFILKGEGEEAGDVWKKYYLNGRVQNAKAKIVIDEFDETKLEPIK